MNRRMLPRLQLLQEVAPFILNSKSIQDSPALPRRIYALSSGMMTPKTLSNIFARQVMENPQHSIFFVGYADPESPAGLLKTARPGNLVSLDPDGPAQPLRCQIEQFQFSAHASRESIVRYAKRLVPKKILLVHGDAVAVEWTRAQLAAELPTSDVIVPPPGMELEL
jgi:Cft2 family RNA processing exonuclease